MIATSSGHRVLKLIPLSLFIVGCSPAAREQPSKTSGAAYASQTNVPTPDYQDRPQPTRAHGIVREASAAPPPDAREVGELWIKRLERRGALLGYGLADSQADAAVSAIDTGLTEREFDRWTGENGWTAPRHIRWSFVSDLVLPSVSDAARPMIRYWPAFITRTGAQPQALHAGRVELRDGCFFVSEPGQASTRLAWFHAEIGVDVDDAGYLVLRDRTDGALRARVGEPLNWAGPASAKIEDSARAALEAACGVHDILVVGSPESTVRFQTRLPGVPGRPR